MRGGNMIYLGTTYGDNIQLAIKCTRYYRTKGKPFTANDVKINRQTMKQLSEKGIITLVAGEKSRDPNHYIVPSVTIDLLERRFPNEL